MRKVVYILLFVLTFALASMGDNTLTEGQIAYAVQQEQCVIEQDTHTLPLCDIASGQNVSSTSARRVLQQSRGGKTHYSLLSRNCLAIIGISTIFEGSYLKSITPISLVFRLCNIRI